MLEFGRGLLTQSGYVRDAKVGMEKWRWATEDKRFVAGCNDGLSGSL